MDLSLTDDQEQLGRAAADFVRRKVVPQLRAGVAAPAVLASLWREMAELGWFALAVPEHRGGLAGSAVDAGLLMEALGTGPVPGPVFETAVLAPAVLGAVDWADGAAHLDAILTGNARVAVGLPAFANAPGTVTVTSLTRNGGRLEGEMLPVLHAAQATHLLLLARDASGPTGHSLVLLPSEVDGLQVEPLPAFAPGYSRVVATAINLAEAAVFPLNDRTASHVAAAVLASIPALCAFQVGSCKKVLEMSIDYSKQRVQFGRPISSFQRVQDHVIDLLNGLDSARWTTYFALSRVGRHEMDVAAMHVAKAVTGESHFAGCDSAHEVHAGIGTDVDYGLVPHTYLSRNLYAYLGTPAWHRRSLVHELDVGRNAAGVVA